MSKMNFSKGKFSRFLQSKGFYVALAVCLVGAGAATWVAVNRTITGIEDSNNFIIENESRFGDFPLVEEAEKTVPDVQKPFSPPAPSSPTPPSLPEQPSKPVAPSDTPVISETSPTLAFSLPVKGSIINAFSEGELVKNVTLGDWRTHDGIDIVVAKGDEIYAAADGVVTDIQNNPLWGTVVTLRHPDGSETLYSGLNQNLPVQMGEAVLIRQVIGRLDGVPCEIEQESHLHFAMRKDNAWVDPLSVIAKAE